MGNVTVAVLKRNVIGGRRIVTADITLSNSYATNGDSLVAADVTSLLQGNSTLANVLAFDAEVGKDGTGIFLDRTNSKIKAFSGRTEVTNAVDLSTTPGAIRCQLEYQQVN